MAALLFLLVTKDMKVENYRSVRGHQQLGNKDQSIAAASGCCR